MNFLRKQQLYILLHKIYSSSELKGNQKLLSSTLPHENSKEPSKINGRAASIEQKRIITDFVSNKEIYDWEIVCNDVLAISKGYINQKNINGCILEACAHNKRLDLAKTFMKYIKKNEKINIGIELLFFRACYASRNQLTDEECKNIESRCDYLFKKYSNLLSGTVFEGLVIGLCCTSSWHKCFDYLKSFNNNKDITGNTYSVLIQKAFEEGEIDLGWNLINQSYNPNIEHSTEVFQSWFNLCKQNLNIEYWKILDFLKETEYVIREDLANLLKNNLKSLGCTVNDTKIIHQIGQCNVCKKILKPVEVTNNEFKQLNECFMKNVMIQNNIFKNSTPTELQTFEDFIKNSSPYDVVVDGLNVAYAYRGKLNNNSLITTVMKILIDKKLKVLLIGRAHLIQNLGRNLDYIKNNAHIFLTNDLSKDDPFVLYAAMYSGLGTKILTRDLMRGHKFLLGETVMKSIFQRWLQKHRLGLKIRPGNNVKVTEPLFYLQTTQVHDDGTWHVPYNEKKKPGVWSKPDSTPDKWMCIQTKINL
ncbi:mitochondrial ribonuclease P catalytic subunit [Daktulosphaira vitifoliae]|uniref:mitochondrial ribonuclease P catalytic subunit n=1 Tax=Daktulosphaira vitifoliae TaxID=58002 RepID=UPI0021AAFE76|nr:mitochondrial ribonuclease P catalytic subunit [Daktulosphaira vitifoliae]